MLDLIRCRAFWFSSDLDHTSLEVIMEGVSHKSITKWAYVLHDKDVYTKEDVEKEIARLKKEYKKCHNALMITEEEYIATHAKAKIGALKNKHWHVALYCDSAVSADTIAKWFGLPTNMLEFPKGRGAFMECVEYLTHEAEKQQALGKYRYPDEEVTANFDWRSELDKFQQSRLRSGKPLSDRDNQRYAVLYDGKTLRQCIAEDKIGYMKDIDKLKKYRLEYITNQKPPKTRINYYICGKGGVGKGLISRAIARSLYPEYKDDEDIFFEVGAKGVAFDGYDGQPVIIWNDRRAIDLLQELNGRGNVFNVFDTHPTRQKQNVKYASVNLCNAVNIVNSVEGYFDFLNGLAGEYQTKDGKTVQAEDKGQSYRRFPFLIPLHEQDFDILLNRGFMDNTNQFEEYIEYKHICGNMQKIAERCGANEELARRLEAQTVKPIADKHHEVMKKFQSETVDEDAIMKEFANYGQVKTPDVGVEKFKKWLMGRTGVDDAMDEIMVYIDRHGLYREYEKLETEVRLKISVVGDADEFIQKTLESHEVRFEVEEERDDHGKLMKKYIISK